VWLWVALGASGNLWEPLGGPGSFWGALGASVSLWEGPGSLWEPLGASGSLWELMGGPGRLWVPPDGFVWFRVVLGGSGLIAEDRNYIGPVQGRFRVVTCDG
jgi:hypothetical protein